MILHSALQQAALGKAGLTSGLADWQDYSTFIIAGAGFSQGAIGWFLPFPIFQKSPEIRILWPLTRWVARAGASWSCEA
jgi:hypothetical protein